MARFRFPFSRSSDLKVQTAVSEPYDSTCSFLSNSLPTLFERKLYKALKDNVPIVDAAISKIVRLIGTFTVSTGVDTLDAQLQDFFCSVRVNGCETGIQSFLSCYLQQLLLYGTAVGEIVPDAAHRTVAALYNASLDDIELSSDGNPFQVTICTVNQNGQKSPVPYPELILCSAIMTEPGQIYGTSLLKGLPFIGETLLKIFHAIDTNWERIGNVRFAVSYKPSDSEKPFSKDRAKLIAAEWSKAMKSTQPKDFITVGDVSIKVIGADNQIPDSHIPVRQLLEQMTAKLSIPPFLLGLSWSSTERMSSQQADILTSELEYYRRVLDTVIRKIVKVYCQLHGIRADCNINWDNINLQDEVELARARLLNAQAQKLESQRKE